MIIIQPSASRTTNPRAPIPSGKLLGYHHSSALRTYNSTFWAKPHDSQRLRLPRLTLTDDLLELLPPVIES
jgi:hypothetical protein